MSKGEFKKIISEKNQLQVMGYLILMQNKHNKSTLSGRTTKWPNYQWTKSESENISFQVKVKNVEDKQSG